MTVTLRYQPTTRFKDGRAAAFETLEEAISQAEADFDESSGEENTSDLVPDVILDGEPGKNWTSDDREVLWRAD
jgi:hypothetical protein